MMWIKKQEKNKNFTKKEFIYKYYLHIHMNLYQRKKIQTRIPCFL